MKTGLAFVFPGQGSQSVGMLSQLAAQYPQVEKTFGRASEVLGLDLWAISQNGPEETLSATQNTQPALLAASIAIWQIWQSESECRPDILAGHSLGEYSALVCAQAIEFDDAICLVAERGRLMQSAVPAGRGGMAAIVGLDDFKIAEVCEIAAEGDILSPANFNSIGQTVLAGQTHAIDRSIDVAKEKGAKIAKRLAVSVPSHCDLMKPAAEKFAQLLDTIEFHPPSLPVINNVDVMMETDPDKIKHALVRQLSYPVQWVRTVQAMISMGITSALEIGPGKVLTGLNKRISKEISTQPVNDPDSLKLALAQLTQDR